MKKMSFLLPFLLVTVVCFVGVEYFYDVVEQRLLALSTVPESEEVVDSQEVNSSTTGEKKYDYQIIISRNLFGGSLVSKEDKTDGKGTIEELDTTLLDIALMGTIAGRKAERRAFILDKTQNSQEIYQKGDAIQGAIIKEILRGKVILTYHGKDEVLHMTTDEEKGQSGGAKPPLRSKSVSVKPRLVKPPPAAAKKMRTVKPTRRFSFKNEKK